MKDSVLRQIADLQSLSHEKLKALWRTLNGGEPPAYNRTFIIKRLTYRIQELAYGGLSEHTRTTMREVLASNGYDESGLPPGSGRKRQRCNPDMPILGTRLVREWNGKRCEVIVVPGGFEFEGKPYRSLTAITKAITGTHWNGRAFFGLRQAMAEKGARQA
jgi:hypothetical protein